MPALVTPLAILFLLGATACDSEASSTAAEDRVADGAKAVDVQAKEVATAEASAARQVDASPRPSSRVRGTAATAEREPLSILDGRRTVRRRYVAMMEAGKPCPDVDRWNDRQLFRLTADAAAAWGALEGAGTPMPDALARFCVYTWNGAGAPAAKPVVPDSVRVDADPDVVVPQAPSLTAGPSLGQARAQQLLERFGATAAGTQAPAGSPYATRTTGLAYVAVVDTANSTRPTDLSTPLAIPSLATWDGRHQHGLTMASIIEASRCPHDQTRCRARQFFAQAFPYDPTTVEPLASGGQLGSLGSLASAIGESVARWRVLPESAHSPLVINMSLGWDVGHGGALPVNHASLLDVAAPNNAIPATVQAVHNALAWASCENVLAIAAAGNTRGAGCEQQGALAPAAWESLSPLTLAECNQYFSIKIEGQAQLPRLAYGAAGLDQGLAPIGNSRLGSMPARGLYAHQASVEVSGSYTQPWTGTSVASAGLAALAAQVWTHRPTLGAPAVLEQIDREGRTVRMDTSWRQNGGTKTKTIAFNTVMQAVAGSDNPYGSTITSGSPVSVAIKADLQSQPQPAPVVTPVTLAGGDPSSAVHCGPRTIQQLAAPGAVALPAASHLSDETRPQPHVPICPNCTIVDETPSGNGGSGSTATLHTPPAYTLHIKVDSHYSGMSVSQPVLTLDDLSTNSSVAVSLAPSQGSGNHQVIDLATYSMPGGQTLAAWIHGHPAITTARLSFMVTKTNQKTETVTQVIDVVR